MDTVVKEEEVIEMYICTMTYILGGRIKGWRGGGYRKLEQKLLNWGGGVRRGSLSRSSHLWH